MGTAQVREAGKKQRHPTEDSFTGLIVGECLADALGLIVEGSSVVECTEFSKRLRSVWYNNGVALT